MELTPEQALQKGIEAHKAGNLQEADRYYTAILKANPKHSDANHNMGILAVGVEKIEEALPFFKIALDANPKIAQYWLSYIEALIKLDRMADAKTVFDQAKSNGAKGDRFDALEIRLYKYKELGDHQTNHEIIEKAIELRENGQYAEAIDFLKNSGKNFTEDPRIAALLSHCYILSEKLEEAIIFLEKAKSLNPNIVSVGCNETRLLLKQKKVDEALAVAIQTNKLFPADIESMAVLASSLRAKGKLNESLKYLNKAIEIDPNYAEALINRGLIWLNQEDKASALIDLENAYKRKPHIKQIWNLVLALKIEFKEFKNAIKIAKEMVKTDPTDEKIFANMALCYQNLKNYNQAVVYYKKAIDLKSNYPEAHNNIGNAFQDQGQLEQAIEAYTKAVTLKPDYADAYNNMGNVFRDLGKLKEGIAAYRKALSIKPKLAETHRHLSSINTYTIRDPHFIQVREMYKDQGLDETSKCNLSFALSKMYEDIGKLGSAFKYLSDGNALRKKLLNYSIKKDQNLFLQLKKTQRKLVNNNLQINKDYNRLSLIFIIGMPRSGTTLVEQIISSHSDVTGAGELPYVSKFGFKLATIPGLIDSQAVSKFRKKYLSKVADISNGKNYITDKMPQNFLFIPLICAAFPEAKIVHVQRSATATCWSNYKHYFVTSNLGYCYSIDDLVAYYELYGDIMKLWQSQYGDRIYNLSYEKLTTDQENQTRKLINHLNLNWQEACLSPQNNKRSVKTSSQQQVRKKVYQGSSEAWRKYELYLKGAFDSLPS